MNVKCQITGCWVSLYSFLIARAVERYCLLTFMSEWTQRQHQLFIYVLLRENLMHPVYLVLKHRCLQWSVHVWVSRLFHQSKYVSVQVRMRMQEVVGAGHGVLEVILQLSCWGSLNVLVQNLLQFLIMSFPPCFQRYFWELFGGFNMINPSDRTAHVCHFVQVSMKHSGSLFLYAGDNGGAFAKNSYGNL